MSLELNIESYFNHPDITATEVGNTSKSNVEYYFQDDDVFQVSLEREKKELSESLGKILTNETIDVLNTTLLADVITTRAIDGNFFPEAGLMFIKTYIKQLLKGKDYISPTILEKLFNKNHELVEIPYAVALYLGGIYYFNNHRTEVSSFLLPQTGDKLFPRINGVSYNGNKEIYNVEDLNFGNWNIKELNTKLSLFFPSARILNRSIYNECRNFGTDLNWEETFKLNINGVIENVNFKPTSLFPPIGYGIQNKFLNYYNKIMFGTFLNGSSEYDNDGLAHVIPGGYLGMIKPIKTYNSNEFEFTAFYRNAFVHNYNYDVNVLISDLNSATKFLGNARTTEDIKLGYIKAFIVFSKLKASFLSNNIGDKDSLFTIIRKLCNAEKNLNSDYQRVNGSLMISDFYFLVSQVFFTSFRNLKPEIKDTNNFDIFHRLNIITIPDLELAQKTLPDRLRALIDRKEDQAQSLTDFLFMIWSMEKENMLSSYKNVSSKSSYILYPSCGGFISPNNLVNKITDLASNNLLKITGSNYVNNIVNKDIINSVGDNGKKIQSKVVLDKTTNKTKRINVVTETHFDAETLLKIDNAYQEQNLPGLFFKDNPLNKFFLINNTDDKTLTFDNEALLKNTTRFLWFDSTKLGEDLKENTIFESLVEGENNLFKLNKTKLLSEAELITQNETTPLYWEQYKINTLMDSLDFSKLNNFQNLFIDFCTFKKEHIRNKYNLKSLMLGSTIIGDIEIQKTKNTYNKNELTSEEINLALIGNSIYQYEFFSEIGLSQYLNVALSLAQRTKVESITNEFCSDNITDLNFSSIGSISESDNEPTISLHKFISRPEILFSDAKNYDELINLFGGETVDSIRYFVRKALFGDQDLESFSDIKKLNLSVIIDKNGTITDNRFDMGDYFDIVLLNRTYIVNKLYTLKHINENELDTVYADLVIEFFKFLNIKFSIGVYKLLIRFIRTYIYFILREGKLLNSAFLPGSDILEPNEFNKLYNKTIA